MQETDADTKGASRAGREIRPPGRTTMFVGVFLMLVAATAAGFSAGTVEDGTRRVMLDDPNGGQFLWPSSGVIDWMSFAAWPVGVAGIILLGYHFEWFGILVAATAAAAGISFGLAVFFPFWTEPPTGHIAAPVGDVAWLWFYAPILLPVMWAVIALLLLGGTLVTGAIRRRRRAER